VDVIVGAVPPGQTKVPGHAIVRAVPSPMVMSVKLVTLVPELDATLLSVNDVTFDVRFSSKIELAWRSRVRVPDDMDTVDARSTVFNG